MPTSGRSERPERPQRSAPATHRRASTEGRDPATVDGPPLVRIDSGMPGITAGLVAVAVVVGLLVAKPWQGGTAQGPSSSPPAAVALPSPGPSATPRPALGANAVTCYSRAAWRFVTFERDGTTEQRGWYAVEPVRNAVRPDDPRISARRIATRPLTAIGFCAPADAGRSAAFEVDGVRVWRIAQRGSPSRVLGIEQLEDSSGEGVARLYRPPPIVGTRRPWPAGTYVIAVATDDATWWFGVRLDPVPE